MLTKKMRTFAILVALLLVTAIGALLFYLPVQKLYSMTVCSLEGDTKQLEIDLKYYRRLFLPDYVKGTVILDGVEYTDQYTLAESFHGIQTNHTLQPGAGAYNTRFDKSTCNDIIEANSNHINFLEISSYDDFGQLHFMYLDSAMVVDGEITGVSYCGPAETAEEALEIYKAFGYNDMD